MSDKKKELFHSLLAKAKAAGVRLPDSKASVAQVIGQQLEASRSASDSNEIDVDAALAGLVEKFGATAPKEEEDSGEDEPPKKKKAKGKVVELDDSGEEEGSEEEEEEVGKKRKKAAKPKEAKPKAAKPKAKEDENPLVYACEENVPFITALKELSDLEYKMGDRFKATAYKKAIPTLAALPYKLKDGKKIAKDKGVPGVGKGIGDKIDQWNATGKIEALERHRNNV
mmetsp:Transcript_15260/g.41094  ORF Transcript_15260/g.41094 Transcript_15260/m.41094 type:complete len:227 (+) Transcript_15260:74-754(+)